MKLLNKSFRPFAIFTVFIVLFSIPVYYYVIQMIYLKDADASLRIKKEKIEDRINDLSLNETDAQKIIETLNSLDIGFLITKTEPTAKISDAKIYTTKRFDKYHNHVEPFRILESSIKIHDQSYNIQIEVDLDEFNDVIPYTASVAGIFFIFILFGYYLVNKQISKKTWSPFLQTIQSLEQFSISSDGPMPEIMSDIEEFQKLSDILQIYTHNNRTIFLRQKEFIGNASHELQTPLMLLQAKTDALMQTATLNENQLSMIDEMKQILGRMSKTNKSLLLLAKIENNQFDFNEKFSLKKCIEKEINFFLDLAQNKNISIENNLKNDLLIEGNKTLVEILINNLFRNAINYNSDPGRIIVFSNHPNEFTISNTSEIGPLENEKIFKRFYKSSSSFKNSGLGLSICKEICKIHDWDIIYSYQNNCHQFLIKF